LWQWDDQWRWPNFNIADSLLVVGAAILIWHAARNPDGARESTAADADSDPVG
jgi:signal peptidase II